MELNLQNIEDIIFFDKKVQAILPEFRYLFDQWSMSKRLPGMQNLGKRSLLDLLNNLEDKHIRKLEEYFADTILLDKIDDRLVRHYSTLIGLNTDNLCKYADFKQFCVYRNRNQLEVTFWR